MTCFNDNTIRIYSMEILYLSSDNLYYFYFFNKTVKQGGLY